MHNIFELFQSYGEKDIPPLDAWEIATEQERRKVFLNHLNRGWLLFGVITLVSSFFISNERVVYWTLLGIIFPTYFLVWWLNRHEKTRWAGVAFTLSVDFGFYGLFLTAVIAMGAHEAFETQATIWMLMGLAVIFAGAFINKWAAPMLVFINMGLLIGTRLALAPQEDPRPSAMVFWALMALTIWLYEGTLEGAFGRLRKVRGSLEMLVQARTQALADTVAQLEQANKNLEAFSTSVSQELVASEARFQQIFQISPAPMLITSAHGITEVNDAFLQMSGFVKEELLGKSSVEANLWFTPPDRDDAFKTLQQQGLLQGYELNFLKKSGEVGGGIMSATVFYQSDGEVRYLCHVLDITERQRLERELQEQRDFVLQIINNLGQGLTVIDEKDEFILLNPTFLHMTGYTQEDLRGKRPVDLTFSAAQELLSQARKDRKQGKVTTYESTVQCKDGSLLSVLITGSPRWKDNQYAGAISILTDLTEIKRNEATLRSTADELKDKNTSLQIINEISFNLHRSYSVQQIAGEAIHALQAYSRSPVIAFYLLGRDTTTLQLIAQFGFDENIIAQAETFSVEGSLSGVALKTQTIVTSEDIAQDMRVVPYIRETLPQKGLHTAISIPLLYQQEVFGVVNLIFQEAYPLSLSQRETLLAIGKTIGLAIANANHLAQAENEAMERRRVEEEIRKLNAALEQRVIERTTQLEEANRELESFAYSVSHDLRTPLRAIEGFVSLLQESDVPFDEPQQHYLTRVYENSQRMSQLLEDLLTFSRLGRQPLKKRPTPLTPLLAEMLEDLQPELRSRQVEWKIAATFPACEADPALLRLVFANLLDNALKYTRLQPLAYIEVGWLAQEGEYVYFVRDNGVGFDMKYAGKLFGVFQRLHGQEFEGTGVGLANVHRIIHRHGGRIWAEAAVNKGATFYFTLPGSHDQ